MQRLPTCRMSDTRNGCSASRRELRVTGTICPSRAVTIGSGLVDMIMNENRDAAPRLRLVCAFLPRKHTTVTVSGRGLYSSGLGPGKIMIICRDSDLPQ
jgi:hypothetical protein